MQISGPISVGEFLDRMSILEIKLENGLEVQTELNFYLTKKDLIDARGFKHFYGIIKKINQALWALEDEKRNSVERYSENYSDVSTLITQLNDLRHQTKKYIDIFFKSEIKELKSHKF